MLVNKQGALWFCESIYGSHEANVLDTNFNKAFDKVPHRLKAHGISVNIYNWIEAWIVDSQQQAVIRGHTAEWKKVSGVSQGSVLSRLLIDKFTGNLMIIISKD